MINRAVEIVQRLHRGLAVHAHMARTFGPISGQANAGELAPVCAHIITILDLESRVLEITSIRLNARQRNGVQIAFEIGKLGCIHWRQAAQVFGIETATRLQQLMTAFKQKRPFGYVIQRQPADDGVETSAR